MNKLVVFLTCVSVLFLSGCWRYGEGDTFGYVTTVESGIVWDYVWIRSDYTSSQTNAYVIDKGNRSLKQRLLVASEKKERIRLHSYNHIGLASSVEGVCGEAVDFEVVETEPK